MTVAVTVPFQTWNDFQSQWRWRQGEHVTAIGPTGSGKTTLLRAILPRRRWQVFFACKPRDPLFVRLAREGYRVERQWPPRHTTAQRYLLWPRMERPQDKTRQAEIFREALDAIYRTGAYAVIIDELFYVAKTLRLESSLEVLWQHGRTLGVSMVAATQRPAFVPLLAYDQASHLFLWRDNDYANVKRLSSLGAADSATIRKTVPVLARHETLYVDTVEGTLIRTKVATR